LNVDPSLTEPVPDAPQDGCSCSDTGLGVTVALGESSERLSFNIAGGSACAVDQSAHVSIRSSCGQSMSLALAADADGGLPRLIIEDSRLTYTDAANVVWTGSLGRRLDDRPNEASVLTSSLQVQVVNASGDADVLLLTFQLCASWSSVSVPC